MKADASANKPPTRAHVSRASRRRNRPSALSTRFTNRRRNGLYNYGYRWYGTIDGRWKSRDPIEERGGVNLYTTNYNDLVGLIDRLGWDVVPPRPANRYQLLARATADEVRQAMRLSNRTGTSFEEEVWKRIQQREQTTGKVINRGCECGEVRVKEVQSAWGSGNAASKWTILREDTNERLNDDPDQRFLLTITGGTCSSYNITIETTWAKDQPRPSPNHRWEVRTLATDYRGGEIDLQSHAIHSTNQPRSSIIRDVEYPDIVDGHFIQKRGRVIIRVIGSKEGQCSCEKVLTIHE